MPLTGDFAALRRVARVINGFAAPGTPQRRAILEAAAGAIKVLTREQFAQGIGPDGAAQVARKDGKPGLQSAKLARGAVAVEVDGDSIHGRSKNSKWSAKLEAHQEGHTFPPRSGVQRRNARGRLISKSKFSRLVEGKASAAWGGGGGSYDYARLTKAGAMGRVRASVQRTRGGMRVLPARPVYPAGGSVLTKRWGDRIGAAVAGAIARSLSPVKK